MISPVEHLIETFNGEILAWAKHKFMEEIHSGFERLEKFDDPLSKELLAVMKKQPAEDLQILANVLPLGVFWKRPEDLERLIQLPTKQREVVERFRADYDRERRSSFSERLEQQIRADNKESRDQFKAVAREGKKIVKKIASEWKWDPVGGGPGEWGLVLQRGWLRTTVSLNLVRDVSLMLSYGIGVFDTTRSRSLRFHDDYPFVLGLHTGRWRVESPERISAKLVEVSQFALWHVREYQKILDSLAPKP